MQAGCSGKTWRLKMTHRYLCELRMYSCAQSRSHRLVITLSSLPSQCSELGDLQISLSYSPSLQRLSVVVLRARGLQLLTDTGCPGLAKVFTSLEMCSISNTACVGFPGVCVQVSLQIHTQAVKIKRSCVVSGENDPYFNHRMTFKLRSQHLDEVCLKFELQQPNDVRSGDQVEEYPVKFESKALFSD